MKGFKSFLFENTTYKLVSLFITLSLWVVIIERKETVMVKTVDLDYVLPPAHVLMGNPIERVDFRVRGPRLSLKRVMEGPSRISVDLSSSQAGKTVVRLYDDLIQLPSGVRVVGLQPTRVAVEIDRARTKFVPIKVDVPEEFLKRHKLSIQSVVPAEVEIQGAESVLKDLKEVKVSDISEDIKQINDPGAVVEVVATLIAPQGSGFLPMREKTVMIRFTKSHRRKK